MNDQVSGKSVRRRRSWYRRRLRIQRSLIAVVMLALLVGVCWRSAGRFLAADSRHASPSSPESWIRGDVHPNLSSLALRASRYAPSANQEHRIYPYSVVPGGFRDADDLRRAAQHDAVVWLHYARFQYKHARLMRATEARAVYLSYRLRNRIFWTRKRFRLHPGELLLTDGSITARTRCGNQVSETPKPEVSEEEPAEDVLDRPVAQLEPIAPALPIRSSLLPASLPAASPSSPQGPELFNGPYLFPYIPYGMPLPPRLCETSAQEQFENSHGIVDNEKKEKPCVPHRHKPPVVPEPSTLVLISSGLCAVYWRYRKTSRSVSV